MKYLSILLLSTLLICSCDKDEDKDIVINSGLVSAWNLSETSGGFAGITCSYQPREVVLTFDYIDNLVITNSVINTTAICGGQEIGMSSDNHKYGVLDHNDKKYLLIDGNELGEIIVTENQFTLDQNSSSNGSGADGFFLVFHK